MNAAVPTRLVPLDRARVVAEFCRGQKPRRRGWECNPATLASLRITLAASRRRCAREWRRSARLDFPATSIAPISRRAPPRKRPAARDSRLPHSRRGAWPIRQLPETLAAVAANRSARREAPITGPAEGVSCEDRRSMWTTTRSPYAHRGRDGATPSFASPSRANPAPAWLCVPAGSFAPRFFLQRACRQTRAARGRGC